MTPALNTLADALYALNLKRGSTPILLKYDPIAKNLVLNGTSGWAIDKLPESIQKPPFQWTASSTDNLHVSISDTSGAATPVS
jgi:hypothetical protein